MSKRLIEEVRRSGGELATESGARLAVEMVTTAIAKLAREGERVTIRGFGTFREQLRAERLARNPRTGEPVKVAARNKLVFKSSE